MLHPETPPLEIKPAHKSWVDSPQSQKLISTIKVEVRGGHAHLDLWSRGGKAGSLIVDAVDLDQWLYRLKGPETRVEVQR